MRTFARWLAIGVLIIGWAAVLSVTIRDLFPWPFVAGMVTVLVIQLATVLSVGPIKGDPPDHLSHLSELKEDWDSYGAGPITEEAIRSARSVAFLPMADGGVQVEAILLGGEVEFEIAPDGSLGPTLVVDADGSWHTWPKEDEE